MVQAVLVGVWLVEAWLEEAGMVSGGEWRARQVHTIKLMHEQVCTEDQWYFYNITTENYRLRCVVKML